MIVPPERQSVWLWAGPGDRELELFHLLRVEPPRFTVSSAMWGEECYRLNEWYAITPAGWEAT